MITSVIDQDRYTYNVGQYFFLKYPKATARYEFINRDKSRKFDVKYLTRLREKVNAMADLQMRPEEFNFLKGLGDLTPEYLNWLKDFRYNPREIQMQIRDDQLVWSFDGLARRGIFWEVVMLALISETYFEKEKDYTKTHMENLTTKRSQMGNLKFVEFGTRRRRSLRWQALAVETLKSAPGFIGTSNVHLAHVFGLKPIGTVSHQYYMASSANFGLENANRKALEEWLTLYEGAKSIALMDTYTTDNFLEVFDTKMAECYGGVRQDSGKPEEIASKIINHYKRVGVNPEKKNLLFSDGLNPIRSQELNKNVTGINKTFCIGTDFTNSIPQSPALKIVIKMTKWNGKSVVKLSDEPSKNSGDQEELKKAKEMFYEKRK